MTISPSPCQRLLFLSLLLVLVVVVSVTATVGDVKFPYRTGALLGISLMTGEVRHRFPVLVGYFCTFGEMSSCLPIFVN